VTKRISKWSSYSEEFRQEVVEQVLSGKMSSNQARRHYGIGGKETVHKWVREYQALSNHFLRTSTMKNQPNENEDQTKEELLAELEALKRLLSLERKRSEAYLTMIKLAEQQFNLSIEKKSGAKRSKK